MQIKKIKINGFGNLENKEIDLKENINIITGKNEARKIHIIKIYRGLSLWGKPQQKRKRNMRL